MNGLDPAISSLVKQIVAKDPENALRWAETDPDDATRKELISFTERKKVKLSKDPSKANNLKIMSLYRGMKQHNLIRHASDCPF